MTKAPTIEGASEAVNAPDNWGREAFRKPTVPEHEAVVFDEPGRVLPSGNYRVCYRSHYLMVTESHGKLRLRVHHGGGEESWVIGGKPLLLALRAVDSDTRYRMLYGIMEGIKDAESHAARETATRYQQALVDGRLRKRKQRGANSYKVWIDPPRAVA